VIEGLAGGGSGDEWVEGEYTTKDETGAGHNHTFASY